MLSFKKCLFLSMSVTLDFLSYHPSVIEINPCQDDLFPLLMSRLVTHLSVEMDLLYLFQGDMLICCNSFQKTTYLTFLTKDFFCISAHIFLHLPFIGFVLKLM